MTEPINLERVFAESSQDQFWAIRGHAIQAYASLEQSLCGIFAHASGTPLDVAGIIFFKIVNVGTMLGILEKLLKKKHGTAYSLFWNSFLATLRQISETRNWIVHWNAATFLEDHGHSLGLTPPNIHDYGPNTPPPIKTANIIEFMEKCAFLARLANMFKMIHTAEIVAQMDARQVQTWRDLFAQPITYPPPNSHPLCQKPQVPESQPPTSPALPQP
jgi:hypothetical protein